MAYAMTFKPDFLERCKRMSGLKSNAAFAGAIGVSESVLSKAMHTNIVSPTMIVGFNRAFGFAFYEVQWLSKDGSSSDGPLTTIVPFNNIESIEQVETVEAEDGGLK